MSEIYKDHGRFKKRAKDLQKWIVEEYSEEKIYKEISDKIVDVINIEPETIDWMNEVQEVQEI